MEEQTMQPFLKVIAVDLYTKYRENISNLCIIFPNKRPIIFFRKYLSEIVEKPIWSPTCITIKEYYEKKSDYELTNDIVLISELYNIYKTILDTNETFDNFYHWGELLLSDFDEIDKYLVDTNKLFKNLTSLKEINELFEYLTEEQIEAITTFWTSFKESIQSKQKENFEKLWVGLNEIYKTFKNRLIEKKIAYEGMMYREVVEKYSMNNNNDNYLQYVFIGFNALNECDKATFNYFKDKNKALFYWDFNDYFIENTQNEAGFFVRENLIKYPNALDNHYLKWNKNTKIDVIPVSSEIGQVKIIESILTNNPEPQNHEKTAILLMDENMLPILLRSIPDYIQKINITMGYSLSKTPIFSLIEIMNAIQNNIQQTKDEYLYYYQNIKNLINHPYVQLLISSDFINKVNNYNKIYISSEELKEIELFIRPIGSFVELIDRIEEIIKALFVEFSKNIENIDELEIRETNIEFESIQTLATVTSGLRTSVGKLQLDIDIKLGFKILIKAVASQKIPFEGEPLSGLQIMGFLESRALDFDYIYIIGANEGLLPQTTTPISFIPYNLRKGYGLPTIEHRDAMYAYYFYRLLTRAKKITTIYSTLQTSANSNEISRYLLQLKYDNYPINWNVPKFEFYNPILKDLIVNKNEDIINKLIERQKDNYLSPSLILDYLECSLRFYFNYIEGIKEKIDISDILNSLNIGNITHKVMYDIYQPYTNKTINNDMLENIYTQADELVKKHIKRLAIDYGDKTSTNNDGRFILLEKIVGKYVSFYKTFDKKVIPFTIKNLEYTVKSIIDIDNNYIKHINIGGRIDRIHEENNNIIIVDYKTGFNINLNFVFPDDALNTTKKEAVQSYIYSVIYADQSSHDDDIFIKIYNIRRRNMAEKNTLIACKNDRKRMKEILASKIREIYDIKIPFEPTKNKSHCRYCPYNKICHK